jgi:putative DNA primase/helicase
MPNLLGYLRNDSGNAERLLALHRHDLRYCHAFRKWLIWDERRWVVDDTEQVRKLAKLAIVEFLKQATQHTSAESDEGRGLLNFSRASLNAYPITSMLRMAQSELVVRPEELDAGPYLLNFVNGTVDVRTGGLRPHRREDFITKLVRHDYRPDAPCPRWLAFLSEIMGNNEALVKYLQVALGYSLTGRTIEKAIFIPFGGGDNGKSTLLNTFRELVPDYSAVIQADSLMVREQNNNSLADLADLFGARFVTTSETEHGQRLSSAKIKRITQGMGKIKVCRKYENPFTFEETHKLWLDTNQKPTIPDADDNAMFERLHPIPFTVTIPKDRRDRDLRTKLLGEGPGILAWAVEGAMRWHRDGLTKPPLVEAANTQWRIESDLLERFLDDCCTTGGNVFGLDLFDAYRAWMDVAGHKHPLSRNEFGVKVAGRPGVSKRHTKWGAEYEGISLLGKRGGRCSIAGAKGKR